jgi:hypothetical protein
MLEPAVRQEEQALPATELVEQRVPEVLETSGPVPPAAAAAAEDEVGTAAVAAGTTGSASAAAAAAAAGIDIEAEWRRWRLSVDLLQSLNSVVQSGHHLHLELEELLWSQRWRHRQRRLLAGTLVVLPLLARTGAGAPGVHHLFVAERNL